MNQFDECVQMMAHHFITSFLVGSSYCMNYVRIGTAVLGPGPPGGS
jgi:hypothetical protein